MPRPCFTLERVHPNPVVGVDEAGRGPLAGPVVAAAVVLDRRRCPRGIDDSKKLCADRRRDLAGEIRARAVVGVGVADVDEIDALNIYWATMLAMTRAVEALAVALGRAPAMVLVDGNRLPRWSYAATAIIGGDARCRSIAAASIVAKHERDCMMIAHDAAHPGYGWAQNKGYGTADHRDALQRLGPSPLHRRSFAPVAACSPRPHADPVALARYGPAESSTPHHHRLSPPGMGGATCGGRTRFVRAGDPPGGR